MSGLIPFNRKNMNIANTGRIFEDFHSMLDDFFNESWSGRSLLGDTFKIDIKEQSNEYLVEAELPGITKDEIDLNIENDTLCISVNRIEENKSEDKNYIHRERRASSMSRCIRLANAVAADIKATLKDGVLAVTVPKDVTSSTAHKIQIE